MTLKLRAVIVDLDNTLALIGDRDPYAGHLCATDGLCRATHTVVLALAPSHAIVVLTGRSEDAREPTRAWLHHYGVSPDLLLMRKPDDDRTSDVYKLDQLEKRILPVYHPILALDDDPRVVRAFRDRNIPCWHVRDWIEHPIRTGHENGG